MAYDEDPEIHLYFSISLDYIPRSVDISEVFGYNMGNIIRESTYADRKKRIFG